MDILLGICQLFEYKFNYTVIVISGFSGLMSLTFWYNILSINEIV